MAVDTFEALISWPWQTGSVPRDSDSMGDADVYTQPDRSTQVTIRASDLRPSADGRKIYATVLYLVEELHSDYTKLRFEEDVEIPVPYNWKVLRVLKVSDYSLQTTIRGRHHEWIPDRRNIANSCVSRSEYKIDGVGDDDHGNAALKLTFRFPVEVEAPRFVQMPLPPRAGAPAQPHR